MRPSDCVGMKRKSLYSRAGRRRTSMPVSMGDGPYVAPVWADIPPPLRTQLWAWGKNFAKRHERTLPAVAAAFAVLAILGGWRLLHPVPRVLTQWDIDTARTEPTTAPSTVEVTIRRNIFVLLKLCSGKSMIAGRCWFCVKVTTPAPRRHTR